MPPSTSRRLGKICRFYKNSNNKLIASDELSFSIESRLIKKDKYHLHIDKVTRDRTLFHLEGAGGSRVVSQVTTLGNYTSIAENSGDFLEVTWSFPEENIDDIVISLDSHGVAKIGDSV